MLRYLLKTIKGKKGEYLLISSLLSLVISFFYVFISFYESIANISTNIEAGLGVDLINFIALALVVFVIIRINSYMVDEDTQEYALLLLTGNNFRKLLKYVFMHIGSLLLFGFIIGGLVGNLWIILINYLYRLIDIDFMIHVPDLFYYVLMYPICMFFLLAITITKINKIDLNINDFLRNRMKTKTVVPEKKTIPYLLYTIIGFLFLSGGFKLTLEQNITMSTYVSFIGVILGIICLTSFLIPFIYYAFHNQFVLKNKRIMFILNGFMELSTTLSVSFVMNSLMIPILLISILFMDYDILKYCIVIIYLFVLFMIFICFILQLNAYCKSLVFKMNTLKSIGLKIKDMYFIQNIQVIIFLIIVSLPFIAFVHLLYSGYLNHLINIELLSILVGSYIVVYLIIGIYMIIKFNKTIKEAYGYVKYLNRG